MQQFRKIVAISFLSLFCMYLLHQLLPHVHHEHGSAEYIVIAETKTKHSHDHDHHHHHDNEDSNKGFDFFGLLFGAHSHTVHLDNILVVKRSTKEEVTAKVIVTKVANVSELWERQTQVHEVWQHPPDPTKSPHLTSVSLRGPPTLG